MSSTVNPSRLRFNGPQALIDVIVQSRQYPTNAASFRNGFVVEGEQRYWVHPPSAAAMTFAAAGVAIDRFTGLVLDKQIEVVNE